MGSFQNRFKMYLVDYTVVARFSNGGTRHEVGFLAICVPVADSDVSTTDTLEY